MSIKCPSPVLINAWKMIEDVWGITHTKKQTNKNRETRIKISDGVHITGNTMKKYTDTLIKIKVYLITYNKKNV